MNTQLNTGLLKMGVGLQTFKDHLFAKTLTLKNTLFTQLVGMGVLELVHVTLVLSMGFLAYFLIRNLPIDNILAIGLSVGAGLVAAYKIYGGSNLVAASVVTEVANLNINPANGLPMVGDLDVMGNPYGFDDERENSAFSHLTSNTYNDEGLN
jgi:hypothetical protein